MGRYLEAGVRIRAAMTRPRRRFTDEQALKAAAILPALNSSAAHAAGDRVR